jgi:hypothetical protein
MALTDIRTFVFVAMLCVPATATMAQQQPSQQQRDDPASVGTGPSSRSPGEMNYEPPKSSVTTNDRGVTMPADASKPDGSTRARDAGSERRERSDNREE